MADDWKDRLREEIADESAPWMEEAIVHSGPGAPFVRRGYRSIDVEAVVSSAWPGPWDARGCVNRTEFCGAGAGLLLFGGYDWDRMVDGCHHLRLRFLLGRRPWNQLLMPDGRRGEYRDAAGAPPYRAIDFAEIDRAILATEGSE